MALATIRAAFLGLLLAALASLSGCSYGDKDRVPVAGKVTFEGAPVDGGSIIFIPEAQDRPKAHAPIVAGSYSLAAGEGPTPGKHRVEILWNRKTGKTIPVPGDEGNITDESVQIIPAKYNTDSTLSADIKAAANTVNYDLTP